MSQKKVDRYKEEKANRQQIMRREKRRFRVEIVVLAAVLAALIGWFSAGVARQVKSNAAKNVVSTEISTAALEGYLSDLSSQLNGTDDAAED
ncbi:MAG: hypothetical protein IJ860_00750 [Eubacterium sp.]|nr:hypothetical protein [Eubacterium sp.]